MMMYDYTWGCNVLTDDELVIVRDFLKLSTCACFFVRNEPPRGFKVLNHTESKG